MLAPEAAPGRTEMTARRLIALLLLLLAVDSVFAARVKPPAAVLREATTGTGLVEYVEAGAGGRFVFRRIERLSGDLDIPELLDLAAPATLQQVLLPGERYLIAYTVYRREGGQFNVDRRGAQLLVSPGLEPALLRDTPEHRAVLAWQPGADAAAMRAQLPALLALLDHADPQLQNFAVTEIVLRPQLSSALDGKARKALLRFAAREQAPAAARARLLQAATLQPDQFGRAEWEKVAAGVLASLPVQVQQKEGEATLAAAAFGLLENARRPLPPASLTRWLASDNAAVAEAALLALRRQDPARELPALQAALQLSLLPAGTREFLLDHRRRLQLTTAPDRAADAGR